MPSVKPPKSNNGDRFVTLVIKKMFVCTKVNVRKQLKILV